ncbi:MAG: hypothetical protein K6G64_01715 [Eubacterium sp.]|nr:hypothetical protein [Eubacterium sp.]
MNSKLVKKIVAYVCALAMVFTTFTGISKTTVKADVDDIFVDGAVKNFGTVAEYAYNYGWLCGAGSDYRYMFITYTGDITNLRLQFVKGDARDNTFYWMDQTKNEATNKHVTFVGEPTLATETENTVVIDLNASGIELDNFDAMDMHYGPGTLNIGYVRLSSSSEIKAVDTMPEETTGEETTGDETPSLDPITLNDDGSPMIKEWISTKKQGDEGYPYEYLGYVYVGAPAGYKYLKLTYKGDTTAFNDLRFEFVGGSTIGFATPYGGQFKTVDGENVPAPTEEAQTVIIDLEASGVDVTKSIDGIHVHQTADNGNFEITDAQLLAKYTAPVDPSTLQDIILNGDENGMSAMIKNFGTIKQGYKYGGYATLKEPTSDYKYLILTYAGDITSIRFQFAFTNNQGNDEVLDGPWWFNKEGQTIYFETADGSEIPLDGGKGTTVVIDLEKSGIDLGKYNGVHMHAGYGEDVKEFSFRIGMARLSTKADLCEIDVMPTETTTKENGQKTTAATAEVKKPAKVAVKKATKKKSAKTVKVSFDKVNGANGYEVAVYKSKKDAKKNKKAVKKLSNVKKVSVKVTSKKLKKCKKLFVRVRAFAVDKKGTKVFGDWSKVKKVKMTKK